MMKINKHIKFLFFLLCVSVYFSVAVGGCDKLYTPPKPPSCIGDTTHHFYCEYDYMTGFKIIEDNYGVLSYNAFLDKGNVHFRSDNPTVNTHKIIQIDSPGTEGQFYAALNSYWDSNHVTNPNYGYNDGYVCGIDSLNRHPASTTIGITELGGERKWSFVLVGRIRRVPEYQIENPLYVEGVLTHEIGHQIIVGWHYGHTGNDDGTCIMRSPLSASMVIPDIRFCDNHICSVYAFTPRLGNDNIQSASNKGLVSNIGLLKGSQLPIEKRFGNFEVNLTFDKNYFLEGENIFCKIKIKNIGTTVDSLKNLSDNTVLQCFKVQNEFNEQSIFKGFHPLLSHDIYTKLLPDEEKHFELELLIAYGIVFTQNDGIGNYYELPPGKYNIQFASSKSIMGKEFVSNQSSVNVVSPENNEYEALFEMREIYKIKSMSVQMKKFREFVYTHPESNYMEQAFYYSLGVPALRTYDLYENIINDCKWFIDKKPNSDYIKTVIWVCAETVYKYENGGEKAYEKFLRETINNYPSTKAAQIVRDYIDSKNKNK